MASDEDEKANDPGLHLFCGVFTVDSGPFLFYCFFNESALVRMEEFISFCSRFPFLS